MQSQQHLSASEFTNIKIKVLSEFNGVQTDICKPINPHKITNIFKYTGAEPQAANLPTKHLASNERKRCTSFNCELATYLS